MNLFVFIAFFFAAVFGAETPPNDPPEEEVAAVRGRLAPLQLFSFVTEREFCGYLYRDATGALEFTEMKRGDRDGCTPQMPAGGIVPIASLHTHGAYDPDVPAEFPTVLDMQSDRSEGVNGYVATPGGRLWFAPEVAFEHDLSTFNGQRGRFLPLWKVYYYHRNLLILYRMAAGPFFWLALLAMGLILLGRYHRDILNS